jgi:hypothetical protein
MREKFTLATIAKQSAFAMAGLVLAATIDVASASTSTGSAGASARFGSQQPVRLAETMAVTKPKYVKKTSRPHKAERGPGTTWLNPQPEPPMGPAKINKGDTWLNPQPEPPRPVTGSKKLH